MNKIFDWFKSRKKEHRPHSNDLLPTRGDCSKSYNNYVNGIKSYEQGRCDSALIYFDKAEDDGFAQCFASERSKLYGVKASCLQQLNYSYEALFYYTKAITLEPYDLNNYYARGSVNFSIMFYDDAISDFEKAIELASEDLDINYPYLEEARFGGYVDIKSMISPQLQLALSNKEKLSNMTEKIENAKNNDAKIFFEKLLEDFKEKRINQIKQRERFRI